MQDLKLDKKSHIPAFTSDSMFNRFDASEGLWKARSTKSSTFLATTSNLLGRCFYEDSCYEWATFLKILFFHGFLHQTECVDDTQRKVQFKL